MRGSSFAVIGVDHLLLEFRLKLLAAYRGCSPGRQAKNTLRLRAVIG